MKKYYSNLILSTTLFFLTGFLLLQAQTIVIKGVVKDSINQHLTYANVFAEPIDKDLNIAFSVTDEKGKYSLKIKKNKSYIVTCSYLGFVNQEVDFKYSKDTIYNFTLKEDLYQLNEINISYTIPIVVKKDTITYKVDKFTTGNERKLKDILKKLPGIEVDRNGNVTANGKKVTTLMVEDKPFFGGNTKLGVNNIPADAINKVQILENYSDVAMLKGLQDDDKVALNIKLKENKKKFVFGDIEVGVGVKEKYLVHPKLFYYSPKTSVNFIGDVTNTGQKSFSIRDYVEFEGGISSMYKDASSYFKLYRSDFAKYLSNQNFKDDTTQFGAFNLRHSISKSSDLSLYVISANSKTISENRSTNQYLFDVPFYENRTNNNEKNNFYTIGKLTLDYDPNKKTDYAFSSVFNVSDSNSLSNINTSVIGETKNIENKSTLDVFSFKQDMSLNNKLSQKHTLTLNANYSYQKDKPNTAWNTNQEILEGLIPISTNDFYQIRQNKRIVSQNISALLKDYWVLHRFHHIYTSFGIKKANTTLFNKDYQLLDNGSINNFASANFGNDFNHNFLDTYLGLEYKFKAGITTFKPAIYYHNYNWSVHQKNETTKRFNKNMFLPQFSIKIAFRNSEKLKFKYRLNARFPQTKSLLDNYILSSFNRVYKGNNQLSNTLYHTFSLNYYKFKLFKKYNFSIGGNFNKKTQSFKTITELAGINQYSSQRMFYEPEISWSANGAFSKTFGNIKSNIKSNYRYNDYYQLVNDSQTQNKSNTVTVEPSIKTLFKKYPNMEIGYKKDFTTYYHHTTSKFTNDKLFANLDFDYKDFIFEADFEYNNYQNKTDNSVKNTYIESNASVFYQKEDNPWGFELNTSNLFNTKFKQKNSQSDFIINDSQTFILPRVVMFKVIYKL